MKRFCWANFVKLVIVAIIGPSTLGAGVILIGVPAMLVGLVCTLLSAVVWLALLDSMWPLWVATPSITDDAMSARIRKMEGRIGGQGDHSRRIADLEKKLASHEFRAADYHNVLHQVVELNQKIDVLAESLGIVIVPDFTKEPPEPTIASIRENGLLGKAEEYINAVMVADKLVGLEYRCRKEQARLLADIGRDGRQAQNADPRKAGSDTAVLGFPLHRSTGEEE